MRRLGIIVMCVVATVAAVSAGGEKNELGAELSSRQPTWRIGRVLVPADRPEAWPRDAGERYLPMPAKEFEQRLDRLRQYGEATGDSGLARAEYEAELVDESLVGRAVWTLAPRDGAASLLALFPGCRLAIELPEWAESKRPAIVGNDVEGRLAAVVDRDERLQFRWTLRGHADEQGQLFLFQPAMCPLSVLRLTLPAEMAPSADHGVVVQEETADDGRGRWRLELGGSTKIELRIARRNQPHQQPLALARESLTYQFGPQGLELAADYSVDVGAEPLGAIVLRLEPPLAPVAVAVNGADRPFTTADEADGATAVTVDLREPLRGSGTLRLTAIAPVVLDSPWKLPLCRLTVATWQEGAIRLFVPAPLLLEDLRLQNCRQTGIGRLSDDKAGQTIEIQSLAGTPQIQLRLGVERQEVEARSAVSVAVRPGEYSGRYQALFSSRQGQRFTIEAEVARHWIIDHVESEPADMLADWSQAHTGVEPGKLTLQLAAALTPERDVRLSISGRRRRGTSPEPLRMADLRMLRFVDVASRGRRLMHVVADGNNQLVLSGAESVEQVDPVELSPEEASLLGSLTKGPVVVDDERARSVSVAIDPAPARFEADIEMEVSVGDQMHESYTMTVSPQGSNVQQLTVLFSQPRSEEPRWSIADERTTSLAAQRLSSAERTALGLTEGEAWRITLLPPRSQPFCLMAQRDAPASAEAPVSLASIHEAAPQRGTVAVKSRGRWLPEVTARRLKAVTPLPPPIGRHGDTVAIYRYEPADDVLLGAEPPLVVGQSAGPQAAAGAWIWRARLTSRWNTTGPEHVLQCEAENAGRGAIEFWLPRGSELRGAWFDGQPAVETLITGPSPVRFTFPLGVRFGSLVLHWVEDTGSPGVVSSCTAPWLRCDAPILMRQWNLWLPPGLAIADATVDGRPMMARPWPRRLIGPLSADGESQPFNPVSTGAWRNLFGLLVGLEPHEILAERFEDSLQRSVAGDSASPSGAARTWAELIRTAWLESGGATTQTPALLVDRRALSDAGIEPAALVREVADLGRISAELVCLAHPQAVIVTTRANSTLVWQQDYSTGFDRSISQGEVFERVTEAVAGRDSALPNWEGWSAEASTTSLAWNDDLQVHLAGNSDWTLARFDCGSSALIEITMVDRRAMIAWASGLFGLVIAGRWWWGRRSLAVSVGLMMAATGVALLIPAAWAPFSAAVWLGLAAGWALAEVRWPVLEAPAADRDDASASRGSYRAAATPIGCLLLAVAWHSFGLAGEPTAIDDPREAHQVLIPVDEQYRPSGDLYYLSQSFRDALVHATDRKPPGAPSYLITQFNLHASIDQQDGGRFSGANWIAQLDVESLESGAEVELPLGGDGSTLIPDGVTLDGQPADFRWDEQRAKLVVEIPTRGRHRLEALVRPHTRSGGVDFAVPPVANTAVHLKTASGEAPQIESLGEMRKTETNSWEAQLGPADRFVLRPGGTSIVTDSSPAVFGVDELYWLRIRPGASTVDARLRMNVEKGRLQTLRIAADSRLRPIVRPEIGTMHVRAVDGNLNRWFLELVRPISGQATIDITWLMDGVRSPGSLRVPRLETSGSRAARRLWGVSLDSAFEYSEEAGEATRGISAEQFSALWLSGAAKPDFAFQRVRPQGQWRLSTRQRQPRLESRYRFAWTFDSQWAEVDGTIQVSSPVEPVFQYRLNIPVEFEISEIVLAARDSDSVRWSRSGSQEVVVLLSSPAVGERTLRVRGRLPRGNEPKVTLPEIRIEGSESAGYQATIFRRAEVLVAVADDAGMKVTPVAEVASGGSDVEPDKVDQEHLPPGDPVAVLADPVGYRPCLLRVDDNRPEVNMTAVMQIDHVDEAWKATLQAQLDVSKGMLDDLQFQIPTGWVGPFEIEPSIPFEVETVAADGQRRLVLHPEAPIEGRMRLQISSPIEMSPGERPFAPVTRLSAADSTAAYFLLPRQLGQQQLVWDTRGLSPKPLPTDLSGGLDVSGYRSYQATSEQPRAVLRSVELMSAQPRVRLADVCVSWQFDGSVGGTATLDILPAGATSCVLAMPLRSKIVQVQLDGSPATTKRLAEDRWEILLGNNQLPRRLELIWTCEFSQLTGNLISCWPPQLESVPVDRTLWTVSAPGGAGKARLVSGIEASSLRSELIRLTGTAALIDSAAGALLDESRDELARWYQPWREALLARRARVEESQLAEPIDPIVSQATADIHRIFREQERLAARLGVAQQTSPVRGPAAVPTVARATDVWRLAQSPSRSLTCAIIPGVESLSIEYPSVSQRSPVLRIAAGMLLLVTGVAVGLSQRRSWIAPTLPKPPMHVWMILIGVVVWLWSTLSVVGLALIGAGTLLAWRRSRWARPNGANGSSFVKPDLGSSVRFRT